MKIKGLQFPVLLFFTLAVCSATWVYLSYLNTSFILELELFSLFSLNFSFSLVIDKVSASFGMIVCLISGSVFTFAHKYMEEDPLVDRFLWILLAFVASMLLLVCSGSLLFLLMGWDGLGITSFALIMYYQSGDSLLASFQTLLINRIGDAIIVLSTFLFVFSSSFSFILVDPVLAGGMGLSLMLVIAALTKSAQYPFSPWLPAAMAAPTPVSALVHSSTLVTAGIFLVIRLSYNFQLGAESTSILVFLGSITCLLGGWAATAENDLKKIIALSTLSQLGVMVFSLGLGMPWLSLFHLYTHALFKALLFLAAGHILMTAYGCQDIRLLGSVAMSVPFTVVMFNVASLCLVGAPFLSAFYSKHLILEMMFSSSLGLFSFSLMIIATIFTAKYSLRVLKSISWSNPVMSMANSQMTVYSFFPMFLLGFGGVVGGKVFSVMESNVYEVPVISNLNSFIINLLAIIGIILALVMKQEKKTFLTTMFFLAPLFNSKTSTPVLKEIKSLDTGWLEMPSCFSSGSFIPVSVRTFRWPENQSFFFLTLFLLMILIFI